MRVRLEYKEQSKSKDKWAVTFCNKAAADMFETSLRQLRTVLATLALANRCRYDCSALKYETLFSLTGEQANIWAADLTVKPLMNGTCVALHIPEHIYLAKLANNHAVIKVIDTKPKFAAYVAAQKTKAYFSELINTPRGWYLCEGDECREYMSAINAVDAMIASAKRWEDQQAEEIAKQEQLKLSYIYPCTSLYKYRMITPLLPDVANVWLQSLQYNSVLPNNSYVFVTPDTAIKREANGYYCLITDVITAV